MREGFYSLIFTGVTGDFGMGVIALDTDTIIGADAAGGLYDGKYEYNTQTKMLDAKQTLTIPAGVALVTGVPAQAQEWSFDFNFSFPRETTETPVLVTTPVGPVNVILRFLRPFPD